MNYDELKQFDPYADFDPEDLEGMTEEELIAEFRRVYGDEITE